MEILLVFILARRNQTVASPVIWNVVYQKVSVPYPWQTDTSIGDWFYRTGQKYMTADEVIQMLVDIVSKTVTCS